MTTPNDAVIDSAFISTALIGSTSEPNATKRSATITIKTSRPIHGRWEATESAKSTVDDSDGRYREPLLAEIARTK